MKKETEELIKKIVWHCDFCGRETGTHWSDDRVSKCPICKKDSCPKCTRQIYVYLKTIDIPLCIGNIEVIVCVECEKKYDHLELECINPEFIIKNK